MTSGKAKTSGAPRKAPKIKSPDPKKPNFMREYDTMKGKKSPMSSKKLSK